MPANSKKLLIKLSHLKKLVAECPPYDNAPEEIRHILETAPGLLKDLRAALRSNDPRVLDQVHDVFAEVETAIEWAVGTVKGIASVEAIRTGKHTDPSLPTYQRLMNRITLFMMTKVDRSLYFSLIREFSGEESVEGNTVYMDPRSETEAFSQWIIHDAILPGETHRLLDLFAEAEMQALPPDEQALLRARCADRPSIYKVVENRRDGDAVYRVQDLLSPETVLRFRDRSSSRTLDVGAIFIGRATPVEGSDELYSPLGVISGIPEILWRLLSPHLDAWADAYFRTHPGSTTTDFFRTHHTRLRRKLRELTESAWHR